MGKTGQAFCRQPSRSVDPERLLEASRGQEMHFEAFSRYLEDISTGPVSQHLSPAVKRLLRLFEPLAVMPERLVSAAPLLLSDGDTAGPQRSPSLVALEWYRRKLIPLLLSRARLDDLRTQFAAEQISAAELSETLADIYDRSPIADPRSEERIWLQTLNSIAVSPEMRAVSDQPVHDLHLISLYANFLTETDQLPAGERDLSVAAEPLVIELMIDLARVS